MRTAAGDERLFSGGGRRPELLDLGAGRIADIDEAGIDIQVLSAVTPGTQNLPGAEGVAFARKLNAWVGEDLDRIAKDRLHKPVQRYFHDNLWITTSAFFRDELLALALATMGEDRIMFSIDYPMAGDPEKDRAQERRETARHRPF